MLYKLSVIFTRNIMQLYVCNLESIKRGTVLYGHSDANFYEAPVIQLYGVDIGGYGCAPSWSLPLGIYPLLFDVIAALSGFMLLCFMSGPQNKEIGK